jgi:hypothetical protein
MKTPDNFTACVHALVFETGVTEAPLTVAGTGFLVGYRGRFFFLTARHALRPDALSPLVLKAPTGRTMELTDVFYIPAEESNADALDLAIVEIDWHQAMRECGEARLLPLERAVGDWQSAHFTSEFLVVGFPKEHSWVEYEDAEVAMGVVELTARYLRPGAETGIHELLVENPPPLQSYSGFSGAPVFMVKHSLGSTTELHLCGMAIQGAAESRLVRFIDISVIVALLDVRCEREQVNKGADKCPI